MIREISDRSPEPGVAHVPTSKPPPIVEPSQLRKRSSSNPPAEDDEGPPQLSDERTAWPSLPPDAMVPAGSPGEEGGGAFSSAPQLAAPPAPSPPTEEPSPLPELPPVQAPAPPPPPPVPRPASAQPPAPPAPPPAPAPASLEARPLEARAASALAPPALELFSAATEEEVVEPEPPEPPYSSPFAVTTEPLVPAPPAPPAERTLPLPAAPPPVPRRPAHAPVEAVAVPAARKRRPWPFVIAFGFLGLAVGVVVHVNSMDDAAVEPSVVTAPVVVSPPSASAPVPAPSASATDPTDLPPGAEVPPGLGLVEVVAPAGTRVRIDGAVAGTGPRVEAIAAPGFHEIRIEQDGGSDKQVVEVRAGKTTRVGAALPP